MIKVGITGGIGSGKSTVCTIFSKLGIPVFNADLAAKHLLDNDLSIKKQIKNIFGKSIYLENDTLNRKKLAQKIFNDQISLQRVNEIVHPAVRMLFETWTKQQTSSYVIQEAAILFESGQHEHFDKIILVIAPLDIKIERVIQRDNVTKELVLERMKNQKNDEEKIELSDYIILNDGNNKLLPQILTIHEQLK